MKQKQIILTVLESKNLRNTGKAVYNYGGFTYHIELDDNGAPFVASITCNDEIEWEIIVRK